MAMSSYETCVSQLDDGLNITVQNSLLIQCLAKSIDENTGTTSDLRDGLDTFFIIYSASLVFFMQAGFAMLCAGSVRLKNVQNTMLKNLLDACGAALGFYTVGYAFAYGGQSYDGKTTFIGNANFFLIGEDDFVFWLFQFAFAATSATIVAGTLAERCQMTAYLCYSVALTGFVYPVICHSVWSYNGFLSATAKDPLFGSGMIDFAGSGVVHLTGGTTALIATKILGSRKGRFFDERGNKLRHPKPFPGHSVALQVLGSFILWFGWYGFNTGSARSIVTAAQSKIAALAATNTTLAAASGGVASLFTNLIIMERLTGEAVFNLNFAMNGCLGGLVSITSGCAVIEPWAAIITGFVAGLLYLAFSRLLVKRCIDDAVDAIPVHMINGLWGLISTGLLASPHLLEAAYGNSKHAGWFYSWGRGSGDFTLMCCQLIGILFILSWVTFLMLPFFLFLNYMGWFRSDALEEIVGLDISYHGGSHHNMNEVKPEYLEAYRKQRDEQLKNRGHNGSTTFEDAEEDGVHVSVDNVVANF
uniref:Ammonium transporter n=1 Tax=Trieres chinensis TaxID=1514140 RepID=A0A7S2E6Q1_TRICV|mmetsp:Transcript_10033/g.21188  ORF Transcript_10033/g.21188 Transcript_10033/m.21188 type:complete len:531 (+) Transcript_10033:169-1761(+)